MQVNDPVNLTVCDGYVWYVKSCNQRCHCDIVYMLRILSYVYVYPRQKSIHFSSVYVIFFR